MSRHVLIVVALVLLSAGGSAETAAVKSQYGLRSAPQCTPDPAKLRGLCNDVYSGTPDGTNPEEYVYAYEHKVYDAACVDFAHDSAASARLKIQNLWSAHQEEFQCSATNFQVSRGSILKYAIEQRRYSIVDNAARSWKVDLNIVDASDDRTVLDFVEEKILQLGPEFDGTLRAYWTLLRRNGAKRCRELASHEGNCGSVGARAGLAELRHALDSGSGPPPRTP